MLGQQFVIKELGDKVIVVLHELDKTVCPWAEIMTCWALFQEEPPQDTFNHLDNYYLTFTDV